MAAHSPGSWHVIRVPGNSRLVIHSEHYDIAETKHAGDAEREAANAQLIAAAPDLLAALTALWGYVKDLQESNPGYLGRLSLQNYEQFNQALLLTPRAIAKATPTADTTSSLWTTNV